MSKDKNSLTAAQLKKMARELGVKGFNSMNKKQLIDAIEDVENVKEEVEVKEKVTKKEPEAVKKRKLQNDDEIEVMNNTSGMYGYIGRSGFSVAMTNYGDTVDIPFGELKRMKAEQPPHINDAYIIILNEQAIEELYLENLYENIFDRDKVESLLKDPEQLAKTLPKMPKSMRETVGSIAVQRIKNQEIFDMRVKKTVEDALGITIDA